MSAASGHHDSPPVVTEKQVSAGGIAFRPCDGGYEVALIRVRDRWQLPKGLIEPGEAEETAALREVREEAGLVTECVRKLDTIEYWYFSNHQIRRVRYHKFVHFFLLRYLSGDVSQHDHEVDEAAWFPISDARGRLAYESERTLMECAERALGELGG